MKILMTGPDNNPSRTLGGIVTVVNIILKNSAQDINYFNRGLGAVSKGSGFVRKLMLFCDTIRNGNYDLVHFHFSLDRRSLWREAMFVAFARIRRIPVILHLHGGVLLFQRRESPLVSGILSAADKIIVLSETEKNSICSLYRVPEGKVAVLPNCVDLKEIPTLEHRLPSVNRLIFFGRLHESKGLEDILEAVSMLKKSSLSFTVTVCGTGPAKDWFIPAMTAVLGSDFEYAGLVWGDKKWQVLETAAVFLLPSRYGEGLPMALLEAMALGKVVIVTDDASITDLVKDNRNGLVVRKRAPAELAEKIRYVLGRTDLQKALGDNAKKTITTGYSAEHYMHNLDAIYSSI